MLLTMTGKLTKRTYAASVYEVQAMLSEAQFEEIATSRAHWRVKRLASLLSAGQAGTFERDAERFVVSEDALAASIEFVNGAGSYCTVGIDHAGVSFRRHAPADAPEPDAVFEVTTAYDDVNFIEKLEDLKGEME